MRKTRPVHSRLFTLIAICVSAVSCGGGEADVTSQPTANQKGPPQRSAIAVVSPPPTTPPPCVVSKPILANIDFGQFGSAADDSPGGPVPVGTTVQTSVAYTDSVGDVHTVVWSWGDGTPNTPGAVTEGAGAGTATAGHTYLEAGVYTVSASVADACAEASVTRQIVVYDPSAGFVTGGGWIDSPAGAYAADPMLTGKANFGFVSKYLKGATVPIGQTEFQFQTAKLNFHSESYDWLVVAGARAQYKGAGTVNGSPGFQFMLTAIDGAVLMGSPVDRFRIKIWHAGPGGMDVLDYDNQTVASLEGGTNEGTAIGGGNIVIHK